MAEEATSLGKRNVEIGAPTSAKGGSREWLDLLKALAIPLVTLFLGFLFNHSLNSRQEKESNMRLYAEMMGRREQADSDLRKDMFKSILETFMSKDPKLRPEEQLKQDVLDLELLAYNFHESLDLAPLFKHVRSRLREEHHRDDAELRERLENVSKEVIERQLTVLSDTGMVERGDTPFSEKLIDDAEAFLIFGPHVVPDPKLQPGAGAARLCLSMNSTDGPRHYRQFKLEVTEYDPRWREIRVRLYASRVLDDQADCQRPDLDLPGYKEIDTRFWVGLFDFPMIDNTHLTHGERCAVSLTQLTPYALNVALAYFPGSRASLKDKPYYDDVMHDLLSEKHLSGHQEN